MPQIERAVIFSAIYRCRRSSGVLAEGGGGGQGAMAPPAKAFRGRKTCKKGCQMHEMKKERYLLSKVFSGAPSRNVNVALNCVAWKSLGP